MKVASTGELLNQYLASQRRIPSVRAFHRGNIDPVITNNQNAVPQPRSESPVASDRSFRRSMSPMCRGLLDVSDITSHDAAILKGASITVPVMGRNQSPEGTGAARLRKLTPATVLLNSVKEEPS